MEQFRARLTTERDHYVEELGRIREDAAKREARLFEAFERALAKIGAGTSLAEQLDGAPPSTSPAGLPPKAAPQAKQEPSTPPDRPAKKLEADRSSAPTASLPKDPEPEPEPEAGPVVGGLIEDEDSPTIDPLAAEWERLKSTPPEKGSTADAKYREGIEQANTNRLDEAESTLREAVRLDPSRSVYLTSLARVLLSNPRYERSGTLPVVRSLLDRAVQLAPDHADTRALHDEVVAEMGE